MQRGRREVVVAREVLVALGNVLDERLKVEGLGGVCGLREIPTQLLRKLCREVRRLSLLDPLAEGFERSAGRRQRLAAGCQLGTVLYLADEAVVIHDIVIRTRSQ